MKLVRRPGHPIWRRIFDILSEEIADGALAEGDRLPTEAELASRFAVNRHTVRQAMAALADDGLVSIEQGRGTFVASRVDPDGPTPAVAVSEWNTRVAVPVSDLLALPEASILSHERLTTGAELAERLDLTPGAAAIQLDLLVQAGDRPAGLLTHYLPAERAAAIVDSMTIVGSLEAALEQLGLSDFKHDESHIVLATPSADDAQALVIDTATPIFWVESLWSTPDRRPLVYSIGRFVGGGADIIVTG